jgi:hypothetical protein
MFDFVRDHTRLALGFMLLLIIPSFVFFGVQGYSRFTDGSRRHAGGMGRRAQALHRPGAPPGPDDGHCPAGNAAIAP